jgi:hypothetical protein
MAGTINGTPAGRIGFMGQINGAGSERATYLKIFKGEVYQAFTNSLIFKETVMNAEISGAREHQFIHTGRMTSAYHTPGTSLLDSAEKLAVAETTVTVDDLLTSQAFLYNLDEKLAHYSTRAPISKQIGQALAERYDRLVARQIFRASTLAAPVTGEPGGFRIALGDNNEYNAQALVDGFFEAAARFDEVNAPQDGRYAVLSPRQYYALISQVDTNILNRDYGGAQGSNALQSGEGLYSIAGIKIRKSNNIPFLGRFGSPTGPTIANGVQVSGLAVTTGWGERNDYGQAAVFANTCGLIYHREAVAAVTAVGPSVETTGADTRVVYQGDLIVGKLAMGCAPVRTVVAGSLDNRTTIT